MRQINSRIMAAGMDAVTLINKILIITIESTEWRIGGGF